VYVNILLLVSESHVEVNSQKLYERFLRGLRCISQYMSRQSRYKPYVPMLLLSVANKIIISNEEACWLELCTDVIVNQIRCT
jgi:hypothetical protein